jgi:hypothetical protein
MALYSLARIDPHRPPGATMPHVQIDNAANWFVRLLAMAFLLSIAMGPAMLGFWMALAIARELPHVEPFRINLLLACVMTFALMLYGMWRLATWSSARADGNLLSPIVYYVLLAPFCALWAVAAVQALLAHRWLEAGSLAFGVVGGIALLAEVRRRALKSRRGDVDAIE